jgi:hypothetical protein
MLHRNCHLIPKLRANITSSIWTSSLIPSNILGAQSMDKTFKYISLKTLVHRWCLKDIGWNQGWSPCLWTYICSKLWSSMSIRMEHQVHWILYEDMPHSDAWSALSCLWRMPSKHPKKFSWYPSLDTPCTGLYRAHGVECQLSGYPVLTRPRCWLWRSHIQWGFM